MSILDEPTWRQRVAERLRRAASGAVVLERLARGGGATRWYLCHSLSQLDEIATELMPGSCVSFYFDQRIRRAVYSDDVSSELVRILDEARELLIGQAEPDGVHFDMQIISGPLELSEYVGGLGDESVVHYGPFPNRDNDGEDAITELLPDQDGVVRSHPH